MRHLTKKKRSDNLCTKWSSRNVGNPSDVRRRDEGSVVGSDCKIARMSDRAEEWLNQSFEVS